MYISIKLAKDDIRNMKALINDVYLNIDLMHYIGYWIKERKVIAGYALYTTIDDKQFKMTKTLAKRACLDIIRRHGVIGLRDCDGEEYEIALQYVLFGDQLYC